MSQCTIEGCPSAAVAKGLCPQHYMRVRRTGSATTTLKPGPKPKPSPGKGQDDAALRAEISRLKAENAALRQPSPRPEPKPEREASLQQRVATLTSELAEAQRQAAHLHMRMVQQGQDVTRLTKDLAAARAVTALDAKEEQAIAKAVRERDKAREEKAEAEARLAGDPGENAKLLRANKRLQAAVSKQNRVNAHLRAMYDKALSTKSAVLTASKRAKLLRILHPDTGNHLTEKERTEAMQIFNGLKIAVVDDP